MTVNLELAFALLAITLVGKGTPAQDLRDGQVSIATTPKHCKGGRQSRAGAVRHSP